MLTNHRLYIDDIGRSMRGYAMWWDLGGRPLADLFITIINLGSPLVNTFPLPQLISISLLVVAGICLARAFGVESRLMAALCTLPLAGQPYYLENMSYSFDSPFMALSMLLCVCAAIQLFGTGKYRLIYSLCMLFAALNLYQAPLGAFFACCLFLMVRGAETAPAPCAFWTFSIIRAGVAGGGASLAYIPVTKIPKLSAYVSQHGEMVGLGGGQLKIWENIRFYFSTLSADWANNAVGWVVLLLFVLTMLLAVRRMARPRDGRAGFSGAAAGYAAGAVVLLALTWLVAYFPQYLLDRPQWSPRTFTGIGAIISCCCLYCHTALRPSAESASDPRKQLAALPVYLTVFVLITFCYAFSKANSEQKFYEDAILTRLVDDIETLSVGRTIKDISYIGRIGANPVLLNSRKKFPLLDRLVSMQIENNWIWGYRQFTYAGLTAFGWRKLTEEDKAAIFKSVSPLVDKTRYAIYLRGDQLVVHFREPN